MKAHYIKLLRTTAQKYDQGWSECEAVDWEEAETLANICQEASHHVVLGVETKAIIGYSIKEDEWDSGYVAQWPTLILGELESN